MRNSYPTLKCEPWRWKMGLSDDHSNIGSPIQARNAQHALRKAFSPTSIIKTLVSSYEKPWSHIHLQSHCVRHIKTNRCPLLRIQRLSGLWDHFIWYMLWSTYIIKSTILNFQMSWGLLRPLGWALPTQRWPASRHCLWWIIGRGINYPSQASNSGKRDVRWPPSNQATWHGQPCILNTFVPTPGGLVGALYSHP